MKLSETEKVVYSQLVDKTVNTGLSSVASSVTYGDAAYKLHADQPENSVEIMISPMGDSRHFAFKSAQEFVLALAWAGVIQRPDLKGKPLNVETRETVGWRDFPRFPTGNLFYSDGYEVMPGVTIIADEATPHHIYLRIHPAPTIQQMGKVVAAANAIESWNDAPLDSDRNAIVNLEARLIAEGSKALIAERAR